MQKLNQFSIASEEVAVEEIASRIKCATIYGFHGGLVRVYNIGECDCKLFGNRVTYNLVV